MTKLLPLHENPSHSAPTSSSDDPSSDNEGDDAREGEGAENLDPSIVTVVHERSPSSSNRNENPLVKVGRFVFAMLAVKL